MLGDLINIIFYLNYNDDEKSIETLRKYKNKFFFFK